MALAGVALLAGCEEPETILVGKRENIRADLAEPMVGAAARAIRLPAQQVNAGWTHRSGSEIYRTAHAALSANPELVWSAPIGSGNSRKYRITAEPVVAGGRIFTLDAHATVTATATSGATVWSRDLTPSRDSSGDASGGGLAFGDGKLFVSTGFGRLTALDPISGRILWEQKLEATGNGTPSVYGGLVYVVAGDDTAWALETGTGKVVWQQGSLPDVSNVQTSAAPAVSDRLVYLSFGSGEVQGVFRKGGLSLWQATIAGQRQGRAVNTVGDISADPVISGDTLFAANHSGRVVALNAESGSRIWTAREGAMSPVWPVGDAVFLVSDRNQLVRLDRETGATVWAVDLPFFTKDRPRRQKRLFGHYGPILAGGQLVVASSDGRVRMFDPASGQVTRTIDVPGGASANPVVAGRTLYVVGANGQLHAFR